jgi:hypothetical protein
MKSSPDSASLRYPIGTYRQPDRASETDIKLWIQSIESFPARLDELLGTPGENRLKRRYRKGGWSVGQLIHHCADSHMNAFIRFKLTVTEDTPAIKPYFEDRWAELPDSSEASVADSMNILKGLHSRWTILLRSMSEADMNRKFFHPEHGKEFSLWGMLGMYAWHCDHHLAHIALALNE